MKVNIAKKEEIAVLLKLMNSDSIEFVSFDMHSGNAITLRLIAKLGVPLAHESITTFDATVEVRATARPGTDIIVFKIDEIKFNPVVGKKDEQKNGGIFGRFIKTVKDLVIDPVAQTFVKDGSGKKMLMEKVSAKIRGSRWHPRKEELELSLNQYLETKYMVFKINHFSMEKELTLDMDIHEKVTET